MESEAILQRLEAEFDTPPEHIRAIVDLLEAGASALFIAHYRRDETGDTGEARTEAIAERLAFLKELEGRKPGIRELAQGREAELGNLAANLDQCFDQELLDELDHYLRPHEHTADARVAELGLTELVDAIRKNQLGDKTPLSAAAGYISEERGLPSEDAVLEAVAMALAERWGENPELLKQARNELSRGILKATAAAPGTKAAKRYQDFFDFQEPVRSISPSRMLALRKAEREGIIKVHLHLPEGRELELYRQRFSPDVDPSSPTGQLLDLIYKHSYESQVRPNCEAIVRLKIKEKADRETVRSFGRSLRAQLLAPPLGPKKCMALRASSKNLWMVILGEDGSTVLKETAALGDEEKHKKATERIGELVREHLPAMVAVPHNRRDEQGVALLKEALKGLEEGGQRPGLILVDETPSLVYATSPAGRRRMPGVETGMRTAINLAQRLRDPLPELVRIEPRGLGLGHNLTEVHQGMLNRMLEAVVSSCVGYVGVDVNKASADFMSRLPGMERDWAKKIVEHRNKNGSFKTLQELHETKLLDDDQFRHLAGFMRIYGGSEALDATCIHPEDYPIVARIAELKGKPVAELFGDNHRDVNLNDVVSEHWGRMRVLDVLTELAGGGRDIRGQLNDSRNENIESYADLKLDQRLRGRITNLTEFGAFVDLGVGHHGLIHMSQIPGSRLRNPARSLRVGEVVTVYVVGLNEKDKRIALSMHKPRHLAEGRQPTVGERMGRQGGGRGRGRREEPQVFSRAARAPEGRRGGRPGRKPRPKSKGDDYGMAETGDPLQRRGPKGGRGPKQPRVITVESERQEEESRGHKGELRSLAGLRALLEKPPAEGEKMDDTTES
ncbi:MAG: helix-hairpin-helix domain-containing protein [Planctomycetota bacterium]|jgi:uncharacterized protein